MKTPKFWQKLTKKQKKRTRNTLILVILIIGGTFGIMGLTKVILRTNYPFVVVISGSMRPSIEAGDLLVIKGMDPEDIEVGDHVAQNGSIIIYETEGIWISPIDQPVVHRVVGSLYNDTEDRYYFITQGDNNTYIDPYPVPEENVYGVVIYQIPKIGLIKMYLERTYLPWVLFGILSVLLVISIIKDTINPEVESKPDVKTKRSNKDSLQDAHTLPSTVSDPPNSEEDDLGL